MYLQLLLLVILLALSGFFSSSETAMTSMTKLKVRRLMDEKRPRAHHMQHWLDDPDSILTTILIGNNIVNIAATALVTLVANDIGKRLSVQTAETVVAAVVLMTVLVLIFGEVVPKTLARRYAEPLALFVCPVLCALRNVLLPFNRSLVAISRGVLWLSRAPKERSQPITHAHFRALIDISEEEGLIPSDVAPMFNGLLELRGTTAAQLMTPRTEMCWARHDAKLTDVLALASASGYSRIPIAEDSPDTILGILYVKDLLVLERTKEGLPPRAQDVMRPPVFVPETRGALDALRILRNKRVHIAIVIDEYGGVSGLLTLEDILEAIVGSIHDEYDESLLFGAGIEFADELQQGQIPDLLRRQFELHGVLLSPQASVLSEEANSRWIVADAASPQRYAIRREDARLNVYDEPTPGLLQLPNGRLRVDARLRLRAIERELHVQTPGNGNLRVGALIQQQLERLPQKGDEVHYGALMFHVTHLNGIQVDQVEVHIDASSTDQNDAKSPEDESG